jgi:hypothetical protein
MSKCHNFLVGVGDPNDPTIARGTITSLLKHLELAQKKHDVTCRRDAPTFRHIFRDVHFEIFQFCLFVSSFIFFLFVSLSVFSCRINLESLCQPLRGGWNNTPWPQNLELHVFGLSSCGLSFYRSPFSSFSFPFPSIPLFFFSAQVTVRQS